MRVYVFNVGSGDHILVQLPNKKYGIIDFHYQSNLGQAEVPAQSFLRKKLEEGEDVHIAFIHLTHPHHDHMKGMESFLNWSQDESVSIEIDDFWWFGGAESSTYEKSIREQLKELKNNQILNTEIKNKAAELYSWMGIVEDSLNNYKFQLIDEIKPLGHISPAVSSYSLAPLRKLCIDFVSKLISSTIQASKLLEKKPIDIDKNIISTALLFVVSKLRIFFGGDLHKNTFMECHNEHQTVIKNRLNIPEFSSDLIKGCHHGSKNSSSEEIWDILIGDKKKSNIVFSAGTRYEHPNPETIKHIYKTAEKKGLNAYFPAPNLTGIPVSKGKFQEADIKILSTNISFEYLEKLELEQEDQNFIYKNEESDHKQEIEYTFAELLHESEVGDKTAPEVNMLSSIIYDIDLNDNSIKTKIGFTSDLKGK